MIVGDAVVTFLGKLQWFYILKVPRLSKGAATKSLLNLIRRMKVPM
jgi:hypothetical protein